MRKERERERERRDHWYSPSHRAPPSPLCQTQPILSFTLLRKFPLSSENFSPHSLSSFTPSPSWRTERAIVGEAQIQSPTHGPVGLIALLKPITDLITPPQLLHRAQTHLQWTWSNRARLCLCHVISPSPSLCDLASRSNPFASLSSFFSQFDWIWWFFFFFGFVSFVFLYLEMILYICLEAKKMWATSRKCVFHCIFKNTTKH